MRSGNSYSLLLLLTFGLSIICFSCKEEKAGKKETEEKKLVQAAPAEKKPVSEQAVPVSFEDHDAYKFSVSLPSGWKMEEMWEGSLDFCDYEVKTKDGTKILELHALLNSRFDAGSITDLYAAALESSKLEITYKVQKQNWFVISGIDKKTKNIVYWKRIWGERFVSDLYLDYPKSKEAEIAPYIGRIAKSFIGE